MGFETVCATNFACVAIGAILSFIVAIYCGSAKSGSSLDITPLT
jgi:hypothetical protein